MKLKDIEIPDAELSRFCERNAIRRLALFGSILRDDYRPDSDIDVLVEFVPDRIPGLLDVARMENELTALAGGRKVDLRTPEDLSRHFRDKVLAAAEVQYIRQ